MINSWGGGEREEEAYKKLGERKRMGDSGEKSTNAKKGWREYEGNRTEERKERRRVRGVVRVFPL